VLLTLTTFTLGSLFFDLASQAPLPQFCKILLAASWVVFSVLFCLDALFHGDADGHAGFVLDARRNVQSIRANPLASTRRRVP
jgi:hypothetical protein